MNEDADEIVFDLGEWDAGRRLLLNGALDQAGIGHVWEAADLVIAAEDEEAVEALIDEFDDAEPLELDDDDDGGEPVSEEDEAAAQKAMGDLFVAADRLVGSPWDGGVGDDFANAAGDVAELPPPFGIDPALWAQVAELAGSLTEQLDADADGDVVASDARMLRELLRKYV
ncbi:MAG: hypothetical protein JWO37_2461 [Acidimicrobiales bacterium]|jgi:hypothetical protein|nr:hypothetical protein [Acidimicrobiales bacterium]